MGIPSVKGFPPGTTVEAYRIILPPGEALPPGFVVPPGAVVQTVPVAPPAAGTGTPIPVPKPNEQLIIHLPPGTQLTEAQAKMLLPEYLWIADKGIFLPPGKALPRGFNLPPGATVEVVPGKPLEAYLPQPLRPLAPPSALAPPGVPSLPLPFSLASRPLRPPAEIDPLYRLPDDWRSADGTINQTSLVETQKTAMEDLNKALGTHFRMREATHFLLFTEAEAGTAIQFTRSCEAVYVNLRHQFTLRRDRVWDGKCVILLFADAGAFATRAKRFDRFAPTFPFDKFAGYFGAVGGRALPRMVHVSLSPKGTDLKTLAHEVAHAFFSAYTKPAVCPLWLNEGVAEYMEIYMDPNYRAARQGVALRFAQSGKSLSSVLAAEGMANFGAEDYCVSCSLVDYLRTTGGGKFERFLDAMRDGQTAQEAMKTSYGLTFADLERVWRAWVLRSATTAPPSKMPLSPTAKP
jgi:hypothetical protein